MTGPRKGSRGHAPKKNTARSRDGSTRDTSRPRRTLAGLHDEPPAKGTPARTRGTRPAGSRAGGGAGGAGEGRTSHPRKVPGRAAAGTAAGRTTEGRRTADGARASENQDTRARRDAHERREKRAGRDTGERRTGGKAGGKAGRTAAGAATAGSRFGVPRAPRVTKALPELRRVQLDAPAPDAVFVDRDGQKLTFPDSNLKRVAARILSARNKAWRYRPFSFPLFTERGTEQSFHFDFYVYDAEDSVIRLILVVPHESREVWDRVGRFKRQYPMYAYELWTPEKLHGLERPRAQLGF